MVVARVILCGLGAQAKYAAESFKQGGLQVRGLVALEDHAPATEHAGLPVLGGWAEIETLTQRHEQDHFIVCCADWRRKESAAEHLHSLGARFASAVHPRATIASSAEVGQGVIINAGAVVQPFARLGDHVMIHSGSVVEHDCVVEDFANIAPNAALCGHVRVGRGAVVYAGAVTLPGVSIGAGAIVGAGSVVREDVHAETTVAGAPARLLQSTNSGGNDGHSS
jgi:acetyltransferase EpsM